MGIGFIEELLLPLRFNCLDSNEGIFEFNAYPTNSFVLKMSPVICIFMSVAYIPESALQTKFYPGGKHWSARSIWSPIWVI